MRACLLFVIGCLLAACQVRQPLVVPTDPEYVDLSVEDIAESFVAVTAEGRTDETTCLEHADKFAIVFRRSGNAVAKFNEGVVWQTCGELQKAQSAYGEALAANPPMVEAFNNRGVVKFTRGDFDGAEKDFESFLNKRVFDSRGRHNLAELHAARYGRDHVDEAFERSERQWKMALAIEPTDIRAFAGLARLYFERAKEGDRSYLLMTELLISQGLAVALADDEERAALHNLAGLVHLQRDQPSRALRAFEAATSANEGHVDAKLNAALIELRLRNFEAADAKLQSVMHAPREDRAFEAMLAQGVARRGQGDYVGAEQAYARIRELDERDPRPAFALGILYADHIGPNSGGDGVAESKRAQAYFEEFLQKSDGDDGLAVARVDAKRRIANAREYRSAIRTQRKLEAEAARLEREQAKQRALERARLLELERRALKARQEHQGSPTRDLVQ